MLSHEFICFAMLMVRRKILKSKVINNCVRRVFIKRRVSNELFLAEFYWNFDSKGGTSRSVCPLFGNDYSPFVEL